MARENWFLGVLREGIDPPHEANTSRYVHEVLTECFGWPFQQIVPQKSGRGFIDYKLEFARSPMGIHVEVKAFGKSLDDRMIRDYLVRRGRLPEGVDFHVGVLTNLQQWNLYVAGPVVKQMTGESLHLVRMTDVEGRRHIEELESLIGHRYAGELRNLRAALGDSASDSMIWHLLLNDDRVVSTIRRECRVIADRHDIQVAVPQREGIAEYITQLLNGEWDDSCPLSLAKFRQAVASAAVAEAVDARITAVFGSRSRVGVVRGAIRERIAIAEQLADATG